MTTSQRSKSRSQSTKAKTAVYVYGVVPADVEAQKNAKGVGDPPAKIEVVREGDIAALVSSISIDNPLGRPEDLQAHAQVLDGTARVAPVLPLRFGAVMADTASVADELLRGHHDEFASALEALEGHAEYIIKGRFDEEAFLSQLLSENKDAAQLRDDIQDKPGEASRNSKMALGELIANVIEQQRQVRTQEVAEELDGVAAQLNPREPTHEWDAVHLAMLAEVDRRGELEDIVEQLNEDWGDLLELRLLGPLAAYDFVVTAEPEG
jgi:hypothetical protein